MGQFERIPGPIFPADPTPLLPHDALPKDASVILVLLDDVGTEWFEWMGVGATYCTDPNFQYARTPFLSELARTGVWFSDCTVESFCGPTRVQVQTGMLAQRTGMGINCRNPNAPLSPRVPEYGFALQDFAFLPGFLRAARPSLATAHFGKWHMCDGWSYTARAHPPEEGPDVNLEDMQRFGYETSSGNIPNVGGDYSWWLTQNGVNEKIQPTDGYDESSYPSAVNSAHAAAWLSQRTSPFFCYVAFGPPHDPFTVPPDSMVGEETRAELDQAGLRPGDGFTAAPTTTYATPHFPLTFRAGVEATDEAIRRVWDAVPARMKKTTYLFVMGDNGTVINARPPGFFHNKRDLFWGGTRVPLVVKTPVVPMAGRKIASIVQGCDLYKTICELLGVPVPPTVAVDSRSFVSLLRGGADRKHAIRPNVIVQAFAPLGVTDPAQWIPSLRQRGIYDGRWRFLNVLGVESLYDESTDPLEIVDVIAQHPVEAERLREELYAVLPQ